MSLFFLFNVFFFWGGVLKQTAEQKRFSAQGLGVRGVPYD